MANSSPEHWSIDGVSLHQYGWSVATVGGSRYDLPPRRGDNIRLAYRPGMVHRPKLPDSRIITLNMWVTGMDPATGNYPPERDMMLRFNDSWDFLRRLVWKPGGGQVDLTRRWFLTIDGQKKLLTATGRAEIGDSMAPTMTGRFRGEFTMTLLMADPYFYGEEPVSAVVPLNTGNNVTTVHNPGHDVAHFGCLVVDLVGPLTNPRLTNMTPDPDIWVQYIGTVPSGRKLRLVITTYEAFVAEPEFTYPENPNQPPPPGSSVLGQIIYRGSRSWMALLPGDNLMRLTGTYTDSGGGPGHAEVRFRPPYV